MLCQEHDHDPNGFEEKARRVHEDVMPVLAEMVAKEDSQGIAVYAAVNVKKSLHHVNLDMVTLREKALNYCLRILNRIGLPSERTLEWVVNLPV